MYRLSGVGGGTGYVAAVGGGHFAEFFQKSYLLEQLLLETYVVNRHIVSRERRFVLLLFIYKHIESVKRYPAVIADNSSAAVCVGKSGKKSAVTRRFHFVGVYSENAVVMCGTVGKKVFYPL